MSIHIRVVKASEQRIRFLANTQSFYKSPDEVGGPIREHFLSPASPRNLDSIETHKVREILWPGPTPEVACPLVVPARTFRRLQGIATS
jgi:hypothetical protein